VTDKYDAEVAYADREVGRLVRWIQGRYPDTLIVVTSDHGEGLNDHPGVPRSSTHGFTLYDSVMHVPLIVNHPSLEAGSRRDEMVQLIDLVPTLAELFDLPLHQEVRGTSLAPMLHGKPAPELAAQVFVDTQFNEMDKIGVREDDRKLIVNRDHDAYKRGDRPDLDQLDKANRAAAQTALRAIEACGSRELYLLPGYENPIRGDLNMAEAMPDELARLEQAIADFEQRTTARPPINRDRNTEIDSAIVDQMKALGYLEE
jgi:arylsulfatase A-like enzyme